MVALAEPPSRTNGTGSRARPGRKPPALTPEERARLRTRHKRNEIIGLIAFCVVLAVVFAMRNYAS